MITGDCRLRFAGSGRNAIFASKEYHLTAIRIVFSHHGDYSFPLMEIISVTRGDHPSDPWRLSPSTKGMLPLRPACPHCRCKGTTYQWRLLCYFVRFGTLLCSSAEKKLFSWFAEVFHDQLHLTAGVAVGSLGGGYSERNQHHYHACAKLRKTKHKYPLRRGYA